MNLSARVKHLEKEIKKHFINQEIKDPNADGFFTALDPDKDWEVFFKENKGKDLFIEALNYSAREVWNDYEPENEESSDDEEEE